MKHTFKFIILIIGCIFSANAENVKDAYYKSKADDQSLAPRLRIAYLDSILSHNPNDTRARMIKSDLCYITGLYDQAAVEYKKLINTSDHVMTLHNRLRAMKMASQSFALAGHRLDAAKISVQLLTSPKPDSLRLYDFDAYNVMIPMALEISDTTLAASYLDSQEKSLKALEATGLFKKYDLNRFRYVMSSYRVNLLNMMGHESEALSLAKSLKSYAVSHSDSIEADLLVGQIYSDLGEETIALNYFDRYKNQDHILYNRRMQNNIHARLLIKKGDLEKALALLDTVVEPEAHDEIYAECLKLKSDILSSLGRDSEAFSLLQEYISLQDSLKKSHPNQAMALRFFEVARADKRTADLTRQRNIWIAITVGLMVLIAVSFIILILMRRKNKILRKENEDLHACFERKEREYSSAIDESSFKDRQLVSSALELTRLVESIDSIGQLASKANPDALAKISREVKNINSSKNVWEIFRLLFERLHPCFFDRLLEAHPGLSTGELRIAAYIVMKMTNKEIAAVINRQPRTVETIKYRLRKHLDLPADITTESYLARFLR